MSFITGDPIQAGIALANAIVAADLCRRQLRQLRRQLDVADSYYYIFRQQRAFYRAVFQYGMSMDVSHGPGDVPIDYAIFSQSSGAEQRLIFEADAEPLYAPRYAFFQGTVPERQGDFYIRILFHFNMTPTSLSRRHERMQLRPDANFVNYATLTVAATNADSLNYWYRFEEYRKIVMDERRFEHMMNAMQFALKRNASVNSGLAMGMDAMGSARTALADFYGKASNTAAGLSGYAISQYRNSNGLRPPSITPQMAGPKLRPNLDGAGLDMDAQVLSEQAFRDSTRRLDRGSARVSGMTGRDKRDFSELEGMWD